MRSSLHILGNIAPLLTGLLTAPLTARALGPDGRGEITIILLWASAIQVVCAFGLPWLARNSLVGSPDSGRYWQSLSARAGLASLPIAFFAWLGVAYSISLEPIESWLVASLFAVSAFSASRGVQTNSLLAFGQQWLYGLSLIMMSAALLGAIVALAATGTLTVVTATAANLAVLILQIALVFAFNRRNMSRGTVATSGTRERFLLRSLVSPWLAQAAEFFVSRADILFVSLVATTSATGVYSVVGLVPQAVYAFCMTLVQASYTPRRHAAGRRRFALVVQLSAVAGIAAAVLCVPVIYYLFPYIFGSEFISTRDFIPAAMAMCLAVSAVAPSIGQGADGGRSATFLPFAYVACFVGALISTAFLPIQWAVAVLGLMLAASAWTSNLITSQTPIFRFDVRELWNWLRQA